MSRDYEYNMLTKKLLAEGYSVENYPNYVQIDSSKLPGDDPLKNLAGGFEYRRWYRDELVYKTGCGKFVMGKEVHEMGMGIDWSHENDNPVIRCPYDKAQCPDNDPQLYGERGGGLCMQCWCVCHQTTEPYDYENSIEKADAEREAEKDRKYQEYSDAHGGRICRNHMYYNERSKEWHLRYEPGDCARLRCSGMCPVLGRELDKKRGNVYYDVKVTRPRYDLDNTLFAGQVDITITKGIRKFKNPVSMDICRNYVQLQKEDLIRDVLLNEYHYELFMAERQGRPFDVEILNIRAEGRESRDLMQDLQDIRDGIIIHHASDDEKRNKAAKSARRKEAKEKRIARLEKKILEIGYHNMDPFSLDRIHADKWLEKSRIEELEELRLRKPLQQKPVQLSLFDLAQDSRL